MTSPDFPRPRAARCSSASFDREVLGPWEAVPAARGDSDKARLRRTVGGGAGTVSVRNLACADCDLAFDWHLHLHLPPAPEEVSRVRRGVHTALSSWGCPSHVIDDSVLLASELVGNAVKYGTDALITVNLLQVGDRLLLEVTDASCARPAVRRADPEDEQGRGMYLVQAIAAAWGSRWDSCGGKTTWCTLALDGSGDTTPPR